jgi:hypothetical protein
MLPGYISGENNGRKVKCYISVDTLLKTTEIKGM